MSTTSRSAPSCQPCSQQFRQQVQVLTPLLPAQQHHQQHQQLRLPSRRVTPACRASSHQQQQQHELTSLSQHNINASTGTSSSSRRRLLLAMASSLLAAAPMLSSTLVQPAQAYLVDETAAQSVFALASRSVVSINDYSTQGDGELLEGVGTGFVWSRYGHVVTNYHVISKYVLDKSGKQSVRVILGGGLDDSSSSAGTSYPARVVGTDAMHDLAVLQIDAPRDMLVPIRVGTSGDLRVGQSVYAIGNPNGLSKTLTAGVVSGLNRTIPAPTGTRIYGAIQTDANINAGNSGGPLLDTFGRLVGVNTASFTRSGTGRGSGVNFALPADLVRTTVPNLIVYGTAAGKGVRSG